MQIANREIKVIDTDSHLTETPELWTARLPAHWQKYAPRVEFDERVAADRWRLGDRWLMKVGYTSHAGWNQFSPSCPPTFDDITPYCFDVSARVKWMDEHGIDVQVLYPNLVAFEGYALMALPDDDAKVAIIRAYNDYQTEFAEAAPGRFIPIAALPFWDRAASITELERCADMGHRGVLWAATLARHGLPDTTDPYWDEFYAVAERLEMSINFHIGVGETSSDFENISELTMGFNPSHNLVQSAHSLLVNGHTVTHIIASGICDRFPSLKFVSVEGGFGYFPYLLEGLDWVWLNDNGPGLFPDRLLPSDYFRRQIYTTFWFEQNSLRLLDLYPDNVMFETDFPHPVGLAPGPGSASPSPRVMLADATSHVAPDILEKVLYRNAADVYRLGR